MPKKARKRSTSSLAGWLFADLSIVLMILFASTGLTSDDLRCDKDGETVSGADCKATPSSTSTTIEPGFGGVRFQPIIVTIDKVFSRSVASFQEKIQREIAIQAQTKPELSTASNWDYGVIIIRGGAKGRSDSRDGDRSAAIALQKISPSSKPTQNWTRIRQSTFFDSGHDSSVPYGSVKLKLFPIISK
jgi:hypothetical protein